MVKIDANILVFNFKRDVKILVVLFIITAFFDSGTTFLKTNGNSKVLLQQEQNPYVRDCVYATKAVGPCLALSKIVGLVYSFLIPGLMWDILRIYALITKHRLASVHEPLITMSLIYVSIVNIYAGLTWYDVKIGIYIDKYGFLSRFFIFSLLFIIEVLHRWGKDIFEVTASHYPPS